MSESNPRIVPGPYYFIAASIVQDGRSCNPSDDRIRLKMVRQCRLAADLATYLRENLPLSSGSPSDWRRRFDVANGRRRLIAIEKLDAIYRELQRGGFAAPIQPDGSVQIPINYAEPVRSAAEDLALAIVQLREWRTAEAPTDRVEPIPVEAVERLEAAVAGLAIPETPTADNETETKGWLGLAVEGWLVHRDGFPEPADFSENPSRLVIFRRLIEAQGQSVDPLELAAALKNTTFKQISDDCDPLNAIKKAISEIRNIIATIGLEIPAKPRRGGGYRIVPITVS